MPRSLPNGTGQALGDGLAVNVGLYLSGQVWYVNSATGADAASPRGLSPEYPVATLQQAITNAASLDVIVLMDGHTETIATVLSLGSKHLTMTAGGSASAKPTVKLTDGVAAGNMVATTTSNSVRWRNVWFPKTTQTKTQASFALAGGQDAFDGCYFEIDTNNASYVKVALGHTVKFKNSTFISVATVKTARAMPAIDLTATAGPSDVEIDSCVFDGGTFGWETYAILENGGFSPTFRLQGRSISLLRGADVSLATGTTGYFQVTLNTGGSRVDWL